MESYAIDFLSEFTCLGPDCPRNCCGGWQILLDDDCVNAYKALPGLRGKYYRYQVILKDRPRIKKLLLRCPFLTSDKKCLHQLCGNTQLMPLVCKNYPRRTIRFNDRYETTLELSCPKAVSLFLDHLGPGKLLPYPAHLKAFWEIDNSDTDYLDYLLSEREKINDYIWSDRSLYQVFEDLFAYVYAQNDCYARDRAEEAKKIELTSDKSAQGLHAVYGNRGFCFYPIKMIDRMLIEGIDDNGILFKDPWFYRYIRRYLKKFSNLTLEAADKFFDTEVKKMMENDSTLELKYKSYFSYCIMEEYLTCFESYTMIRELSLCILYTQLLMLFDLMEFLKTGRVDRKIQERIITSAEHSIRHNPLLTKALYTIIREEFL